MSATMPRRLNNLAFPVFRFFCYLFLVCFVTSFTVNAADDDDYLKAIEMETDKVERNNGEDEPVQSELAGTSTGGGGDGFSYGLSIDGFENELKEKYTGSSVFYKKLPRRNQEEIYQEYFKGASYEQIQKKIMNRYLGR